MTIWTRDSCAPCKTLKYFLDKKGVKYEERSADEVRIAPTIKIGDHLIEGFNLARILDLLEKAPEGASS